MCTATNEIYTYRHTLSLHDALPSSVHEIARGQRGAAQKFRMPLVDHALAELRGQKRDAGFFDELQQHPAGHCAVRAGADDERSEEHTSELQSLMRISYVVFCLKTKIHILIH